MYLAPPPAAARVLRISIQHSKRSDSTQNECEKLRVRAHTYKTKKIRVGAHTKKKKYEWEHSKKKKRCGSTPTKKKIGTGERTDIVSVRLATAFTFSSSGQADLPLKASLVIA